MLKRYLLRLLIRLPIAGVVLFLYVFRREVLAGAGDFSFVRPFSFLHVLWALLMFNMIIHLFTIDKLSLANNKQFKRYYQSAGTAKYGFAALTVYIKKARQRGILVIVSWLLLHALLIPLYQNKLLGPPEMIVLSIIYFIADIFGMLFFCPFQRWLLKCNCCVQCPIYGWSHIMMYTPMLFFISFYSYSLFFMSFLLWLKWEMAIIRHPERFWVKSNAALSCAHCTEQLCFYKKPAS